MQIAYVNVFVSDLERASEFYQDKLGFTREQSDADHGYASFSAGSIRLGVAVAGADASSLVGRHTGIGLSVDDLEAAHTRLSALGVAFDSPPTRQPWGGFLAIVADPDGNLFYLDEISAAHSGPS